jgi:hypothetical protein
MNDPNLVDVIQALEKSLNALRLILFCVGFLVGMGLGGIFRRKR